VDSRTCAGLALALRRPNPARRPPGPTRAACVVVALLTVAVPGPVAGQELPFAVTIIDWNPETRERQRRAFRSEAEEHEVLFCVESWTTTPLGNGMERVVVTAVRREHAGERTRIRDVGARCLGNDGRALPMFHTHADGNCQFSPSDLVALVARAAPFEGVQCGERHFVWEFAWRVAAIAAAAELTRMSSRPPPSGKNGRGGRDTTSVRDPQP